MRKYRKKAVAKWDFVGDESKEQLSFKKGDVTVILEVLVLILILLHLFLILIFINIFFFSSLHLLASPLILHLLL